MYATSYDFNGTHSHTHSVRLLRWWQKSFLSFAKSGETQLAMYRCDENLNKIRALGVADSLNPFSEEIRRKNC